MSEEFSIYPHIRVDVEWKNSFAQAKEYQTRWNIKFSNKTYGSINESIVPLFPEMIFFFAFFSLVDDDFF